MQRIGKYEVDGELGTGSMGVIYRARDTILEREVALKTIAGGGILDPELKERFYREAKAGARLNHPNVVTVYELGEHEGLLFIALELLNGCDLRQFIAERRAMPVAAKIEAIAGVCEGLQHAHESGIIHRDLKPSNIFLTSENVGKILDFGVARVAASQLTVLGRVLGTPFYMAPEQILGKPCDARSDLFSMALVAFEFLSYAHPFAGASIPKRIINDQADSLLARDPSLPPALDAILAKALAKDPAQRYATAGEFARALREVMAGPSTVLVETQAAPPPPPPVAAPSPMLENANTEYKMSEILAALQEFDVAMEQVNVAAARSSLARIERLAAADDRFETAAKESRGRLEEMAARYPEAVHVEAPPPVRAAPPVYSAPPVYAPPSAPAAAPTPVAPAPSPVASSPTLMRAQPPAPAPAYEAAASSGSSSLSDATSFFSGTSSPVAPRPAPLERPSYRAPSTPVPQPPAPAPTQYAPPAPQAAPQAAPVPAPAAAAKSRTPVIIMAIAAVAVILIGAGVFFILRPSQATVVPALATAQVSTAQAAVMSDPSDSAKVLVTLKKGDTVNVVRPPRSRTQEWTEVQYVTPDHTYPAGTIKTGTLTNWSSTKSDVALYLIEMNAPADAASEGELRAYRDRISAFLDRFPSAPEHAQAQTDLNNVDAALARLAAPASAKPAEAVAAPAAAVQADPAAILGRAQRLWEQGQYDQSERLLKRLLQDKPDYTAAKQLLERVQKARALEGGK